MSSKLLRTIKSYSRRQGRMTLTQQTALEALWPQYGIDVALGLIDLNKIFGRNALKILEIGFGMGSSLLEMAQAFPGHDFIGVEVHQPGLGALLNNIEQKKLNNIKVFNADSVEVLEKCIATASLDRIQIFFPDPWPKRRHHKRRLIQESFVKLVHSKLRSQGCLHLATDWQDYAQHMLRVLSASSGFYNTQAKGEFSARPDYRPATKYEKRGERLGHQVWDLIFIRKDSQGVLR